MSIGFWQVLLILLIVLIVFGAGRLPKVAEDVAKTVRKFRSGLKDEPDDGPAPPPDPPRRLAGPPGGGRGEVGTEDTLAR